MHPKFDPTWVQTHEFQIREVVSCYWDACSNHSAISDFSPYIYQHNPGESMAICNHQTDSPLYEQPNREICKHRKSIVIQNIEYPYWDKALLNNTKLQLKHGPLLVSQA